MALASTGTYLETFIASVEYLPSEVERLLKTIRDLDERSEGLRTLINDQVNACVLLPPAPSRKTSADQVSEVNQLRSCIEANQAELAHLTHEKLQLARQIFQLVVASLDQLNDNINRFETELDMHATDQPGGPPSPMAQPMERKGSGLGLERLPSKNSVAYGGGGSLKGQQYALQQQQLQQQQVVQQAMQQQQQQQQRQAQGQAQGGQQQRFRGQGSGDYAAEIMPPPPPQQRRRTPVASQQYAAQQQAQWAAQQEEAEEDGEEEEEDAGAEEEGVELFCFCNRPSYGDMIKCDNNQCQHKWFHFECVGLTEDIGSDEAWFCPDCTGQQRRNRT